MNNALTLCVFNEKKDDDVEEVEIWMYVHCFLGVTPTFVGVSCQMTAEQHSIPASAGSIATRRVGKCIAGTLSVNPQDGIRFLSKNFVSFLCLCNDDLYFWLL